MMAASFTAISFPTFSFLAILSLLAPFAWHVKHRNVAACSLIFWLFLINLMNFVNALIWPTDDVSRWWSGHGLCDVEAKLRWPAFVGTAGSSACIVRRLAIVMDVDRATVVTTRAQRRRNLIIDL